MNKQLNKCTLAINLVCVLLASHSLAEQPPTGIQRKTTDAVPIKAQAAPAPSGTNQSTGIQVQHVRMSAHGRIVDLRYKVTDGERAKFISNKELKPLMVDQKTGEKLTVPSGPKTGSLRNLGAMSDTNKTYIMMFSNPKQVIKSGSIVDLVLGDITIKDLKVE